MNAYLTPAATAAIKAKNAEHIKANDARRAQRRTERLIAQAMSKARDIPAFPDSGLVRL